jgi:hypothetical protein
MIRLFARILNVLDHVVPLRIRTRTACSAHDELHDDRYVRDECNARPGSSAEHPVSAAMSQLNLSDETQVFYRMLKSVTIGGVTLITLAHMLTTYHASEVAAAEQLKEAPQRLIAAAKEAREQEAKSSVSISRLPVWEDDGTHPSHVLTTVDAKPRL